MLTSHRCLVWIRPSLSGIGIYWKQMTVADVWFSGQYTHLPCLIKLLKFNKLKGLVYHLNIKKNYFSSQEAKSSQISIPGLIIVSCFKVSSLAVTHKESIRFELFLNFTAEPQTCRITCTTGGIPLCLHSATGTSALRTLLLSIWKHKADQKTT